jgi:sugar phosphate isomerase/epimerase
MRAAVMSHVLETSGDLFVEARRLGFAGIELVLTREQLRAPDEGYLRQLRRSADASSVEIPALVLGDHNYGGIAAEDVSVARRAAEEVEIAIGWAAGLGAEVVLVPFFLDALLVGDADVDRCTAAFRALCPLAERSGVVLCFEGLLPAEQVRAMAERVGSPAFACCFDLANPLRRGLDPPAELRALGDLVRRVHVKDRSEAGDVRPGRGRVDFASCSRALDEIGYDGWLTLESPSGPPPLAARDLSFARSVFPRLACEREWPRFGAFSYDFERGRWKELIAAFERFGLVDVVLGQALLDECLEQPTVADRARSQLDEHGLSVPALAGYRNLVAPDRQTRATNIAYIARCLELAPAVGSYVVCTETGTRHPDSDWTDTPSNRGDEAWRLLDDALERLVPVAESAGTIVALEAHVKNVLKTREQLLGILERFPTEHLQVVCDPYNYLSSDLLPEQERVTQGLLERFEDRFVIAHLKDVDAGGAEVGSPELGTGVFDQQPYLEFLRTRRPDLPLVLEHLPLEHIPDAMRRVRDLVDNGRR